MLQPVTTKLLLKYNDIYIYLGLELTASFDSIMQKLHCRLEITSPFPNAFSNLHQS